jgi:DNA-binding NtrC family response regulator
MSNPCILIVEADILVRHPLAEYLRECGYDVLEASSAQEARRLLEYCMTAVDIVLADTEASGGGFALATWIRKNHPAIEVILASTVAKAAEKAGDLCREGPAPSRAYDHQLILQRVRRSLAARDREAPPRSNKVRRAPKQRTATR